MPLRPSLRSLCLLFSASLGISANAVAESSIAERVANQQSLRISVDAGAGKFARLTAVDKAKLLSAQARIFEILDGVPTESELTGTRRARLVAAESEIARIVAKLDPPTAKAKVVCAYEARIGSNRKERICRAINSSDSAEARRSLQRMQSR